MKKNSYCMLAALFVLLFSNLSFAEDADPCASWPVTLTLADGFYEIGSVNALYKFACMVNNGATDINGRLTADICVNACGEGESVLDADGALNGSGENFKSWTPMGSSSQNFLGTFDGNGHTIRGLYFNSENTSHVGLFGYISGSTAKVQNVGVVDSYFKGEYYVGGVVGYNAGGTVSNVYNTGVVSGKFKVGGVVGENYEGTVSKVYNTGSVSGNDNVGGVVGENYEGTVSKVYNTGSVSGYYDVGGVVGFNNKGTVSNAYNTGSVSGSGDDVGGVVGYSFNGTVSNVYNTGSVSGSGDDVGGVVGYNYGTVSNGFFNTTYYSGNAIGESEGTADNVKGLSMTDLANLTVGNGGDFPLLEGETESPWAKGIYYDKATGKLANSELPYLKSLPKPQDVEMEFNVKDNVIQISSTDDLKNFAKLVNEYHITDVDAELTTNLTVNSNLLGENNANVDAETGEYKGNAPANVWTPIGTSSAKYTGTFDGKGHTIRGLYFNDESTDYVGLFGHISGSTAKVQNVGVVDSYFKGCLYVGGVVAYNSHGTVSNVYNTGSVSGKTYVGGVVGYSYYSTVSNVYNTGSVSGKTYVGGVVGYISSNGTVSNGFFNKAYYSGNAIGGGSGTANTVVGKTSTELANLTVGNGGDFPLLKGETVSPWAKGIYYDKATGKLANSELPYLKSLPKPQDVEMEFNVKDNVIQISSTEDFKNFAKLVNEYHITDVDAELTTNLTVNSNLLGENNVNVDAETGEYKGNAPANVWTPIGTYGKPYEGTFDGNGHTIRGLYFNNSKADYVGLFGYIGVSAKVQNVGVVDSYFKGSQYIGGVVGDNYGGTVSNVYNTGAVSGNTDVGGVVGRNYDGTVSNVYNTGSVSGTYNVGGVVGMNYSSVSNVYYNTEVTCEPCSDDYGMSSEKFHDGTVALLLHDWCEKEESSDECKEGGLNGSVWGQNVGQATGNDAAPTLSGVLKLGPLTVAKDAAGKDSAAIDGASELEMKIPVEFNVPSVTFKRTFAGSGYSTIMLPFQPNCSEGDCIKNGENVKFYEFGSYANATVGVTEVSPSALKANTPYLVSVTDGATELVFKNGGTFNTTEGGVFNSETGDYKKVLDDGEGNVNGWTIYGTYAYKKWLGGDEGLGKTYGFAANDGVNDPAIVGEFRKVGAGAYIYPMRAYLEYTAPAALARPAANGEIRTVASLPDEINVVIVDKGNVGTEVAGSDDASGEQTTKVIGTINTCTGEFKFANDRWFDLQGRYLGVKKPTQKGAYYNNGKKVIVK